ncbi:hypothetical protein [Chryseolinea lacunae]|uniref:Uncharacterized protein n=1 Tax=Chryseolinea lacunae TaxID=2801331 RepID=A0ABS1KPJ1_9BACT|nr:hypothetical protein [Chryseolinea lacunae]MBL0741369.1 hypothetical protein [Chryseolinea lacunae]
MNEQNKIIRPLPEFLTQEVIDKLAHLLDTASANDYRETLIELYHVYILREHNALHVKFTEMAHHVDLLCELLKMIDGVLHPRPRRSGIEETRLRKPR